MGRPSTPLLSVERIAEAALALVDSAGEFTVAGIAASLGVRPSSLYNHVASKAQILEAMRSIIFRDVPAFGSVPGADWETSIRGALRAYRDAFARHPRLIPMLTAQTVSAPDVMRIYDDLARVLSAAGIQEGRLLDVITVLDSFVIGSALDLVAPDEVWDADQAEAPELVRAIRSATPGRTRADRAFELGIDLLLGGLGELGPGAATR
jgi:AcrR family transcriptional regulator